MAVLKSRISRLAGAKAYTGFPVFQIQASDLRVSFRAYVALRV